ncbi:MAG: iron-containing alcohol dehydrogenase [Deltaproteobacteria bacterium]|nr:iron-containing alcohol dehydrogenase [Deltaproteobacteria bacterium]
MWPAFEHQGRTRVVFGAGALARLGELAAALGGTRVLLVSDAGVGRAGHSQRAEAALTGAGLHVQRFDEVAENPNTADVEVCARAMADARPDLLVAVGGGSAIDTAKAAALIRASGRPLSEHAGHGRVERPVVPLVVVPTTAGTGSECQSAALIGDPESHRKVACLDPQMAPRLALLDPELTLSLPGVVTASSGLDTLTHALEAAVTRARTPSSDLYAREAFRLAVEALGRVLEHPSDLAARGRMLWASALAGMAIEESMLGAAHAAGNPLTRTRGLTHGFAVGVMLPEVMRFNAAEAPARDVYAALSRLAGLAAPDADADAAISALIERVDQLVERSGTRAAWRVAGVGETDIPALADEAASQWTAGYNPRAVSAADFAALYAAARSRHRDPRSPL